MLKNIEGVGCLQALNKQMSLLNVCKLSFRTTAFLTQLPAVINLVTHSLPECKCKWKRSNADIADGDKLEKVGSGSKIVIVSNSSED